MNFRNVKLSRMAAKLAAVALAMGLATTADAREMRFSSWESAQGFLSSKILQAWIDEVNPQLSDGASFKLYPGAILGAPPAQQELVKKGVADVAMVGPTQTPGLFPLSTIVEVPFLAQNSANGTKILQTLLDDGLLGKEYEDFKVIGLFSTATFNPMTRSKPVELPADLQGLRMRSASPFMSHLMTIGGGSGVAVPPPAVYESLERNVVDGALWTADAYNSFRLDEMAPNFTMVNFTASPLAILMNKRTYEGLSEADRAVIDSRSGNWFAEWVSKIVDDFDQEQLSLMEKNPKVNLIVPEGEKLDQWLKAYANAGQDWVEAQKEFGVDAAPALKRAQEVSSGK